MNAQSDFAAQVAQAGTTQGWDQARRLIGEQWDRLAVENPRALLEAIKALPGDVLIDNPGLILGANYVQRLLIDGDPARFSPDPRLGPLGDLGAAQNVETQLILLTGRIAKARSEGTPRAALPHIATARELLNGLSAQQHAGMAHNLPNLRLQWARTLEAADEPGAIEEYEKAYELAQLIGQPFLARRAAAHLAWHHTDRGTLTLADSWLARARAFREPSPRYDATLYLAAAMLRLERNDAAGADVEFARLTAVPPGETWAAALWVHSVRARTAADGVKVNARIATELSRHSLAQQTSSANSRYLRAARLRVAALLRGESAEPLTTTASPHEHFTTAVRALRAKRYQRALANSVRARQRDPSLRTHAGALLVAAAAQHGLGQHDRAIETMEQARVIIESERMHSAYALIPAAELARLNAAPLRESAAAVGPATPDTDRSPAPAALTLRQREILALLATDRPLPEIAAELYISRNTLKSALRRIYAVLGVGSRHDAVEAMRRAAHRPA